ncbi:MAG: FHA domain-containing protein [Deltaproteobacteria bacterium]|nr:FHA domain-containing protein [Deltaproteobacteria bacterium]
MRGLKIELLRNECRSGVIWFFHGNELISGKNRRFIIPHIKSIGDIFRVFLGYRHRFFQNLSFEDIFFNGEKVEYLEQRVFTGHFVLKISDNEYYVELIEMPAFPELIYCSLMSNDDELIDSFTLPQTGQIYFGRGSDCYLKLKGNGISRHHGEIICGDNDKIINIIGKNAKILVHNVSSESKVVIRKDLHFNMGNSKLVFY